MLNDNDNNVNEYVSIMAAFGFQPMYREVTRSESGICLDHIFIKRKIRCDQTQFSSYIIDYELTDHLPIMFNVSTNYNNHNDINSTKNKNTLKKIDYQKLLALALETNWKDTLNYTN